MAQTFEGLGAAVLRFNFRGVGRSEGRFDEGRGELEDARAALTFLRGRCPQARRWVAGFSFGSWIASGLASEPDVALLVLVAPPASRSSFHSLRDIAIPKLVVHGTEDRVSPIDAVRADFPSWAGPKAMIEVEGASHFFHKQLEDLASAVLRGMKQLGIEVDGDSP
jgi:hypothetical protein